MSQRRNALVGLVVTGALTGPGAAPARANAPGPGGNGAAAICVPVPGASHTTPAGGARYGFVYGPRSSVVGNVHVDCAPGP
jgi:hypothetical protein